MLTTAMSLIKRASALCPGALRSGGGPSCSSAGLMVRPQAPMEASMALLVSTPLAQRTVTTGASGAGARSAISIVKASLEIRFFTKVGHEAVVRRAQPGDAKAMQAFLDRCEVFQRDHRASSPGLAQAADDHIRMAASPRHDTLVAVVQGRIVGMAITQPQGQEGQRPVDQEVLAALGLKARQVGVSHLLVEPQSRGQGIGKVLKQAQVRGAGEAGCDAVVGETTSSTMKALAERMGGQVQGKGTLGVTVMQTVRDAKED